MKNSQSFYLLFLLLLSATTSVAQQPLDSSKTIQYKNIIRYNLSGAIFFGIGDNIIFGYERIVSPRRSFSVNAGRTSLPKFFSIVTDSFSLQKDVDRSGFNFSVDYRFYLTKENKFDVPRGVYIGPYYSYNQFESVNRWAHKNNMTANEIRTDSKFNIHTIGFELGYQFILWKRLALDIVMIGPGIGFYEYKATFQGTVDIDSGIKEELSDGLKQLLTQKIPGMNFIFSDNEIDASGALKTTDVGYRYIVHIGYAF